MSISAKRKRRLLLQGLRENATAFDTHLSESYGDPATLRKLQKQGSIGGSTFDIANFNKCAKTIPTPYYPNGVTMDLMDGSTEHPYDATKVSLLELKAHDVALVASKNVDHLEEYVNRVVARTSLASSASGSAESYLRLLDLTPPAGVTQEQQRKNLDLMAKLNAAHAEQHPGHDELSARMNNYELAFRMQMQVPETLDLSKEDEKTKELYGIGKDSTDSFGRKCLLARKLIEKGVRFVQLYNGSWDSHDYIERAHGNLVRGVDQPIAALITDLKQRGLLESTLIVWCGEFGRTPDNGVRGGTAYGRDHNPNAMTMWLAGGGCNAGHTIGATDELGMAAVEGKAHVRDFHVTLLRLLGLDDNKLTYYHAGRFKQLSQFGGTVIKGLMA